VKYRKKLFLKYDSEIKSSISKVSTTKNFVIEKMESDKDHIHILVSAKPNISPYSIIHAIKQQTTYDLWQTNAKELQKEFWKEHVLWTKSYFVNSIGSVSKEAIERYISTQGGSSAAPKGTAGFPPNY
jgi:putative transposase